MVLMLVMGDKDEAINIKNMIFIRFSAVQYILRGELRAMKNPRIVSIIFIVQGMIRELRIPLADVLQNYTYIFNTLYLPDAHVCIYLLQLKLEVFHQRLRELLWSTRTAGQLFFQQRSISSSVAFWHQEPKSIRRSILSRGNRFTWNSDYYLRIPTLGQLTSPL